MERFINNCVIKEKKERFLYELAKKRDFLIARFSHNALSLIDKKFVLYFGKKYDTAIGFFKCSDQIELNRMYYGEVKCSFSGFQTIIIDEFGPMIAISEKYALIKDEDNNLIVTNL